MVKSRKGGSFRGRTKAIGSNARRVGGILERTVRLAKIKSARMRKAQIRSVPVGVSGKFD